MSRYLVIRHRVNNYEEWKKAFDEHCEVRAEFGLKGGEILRDVADPTELSIMLECEDVERAKEVTQLKELREAMKHAGVVGKPDFYFVEEVSRVAECAPSEIRETEGWCDCC